MKIIIICTALFLSACDPAVKDQQTQDIKKDSPVVTVPVQPKPAVKPAPADTTPTLQKYANKAFREVSVMRINENTFKVNGQARVFEANISWVVEDGHNELVKGFQMTDAGAPAWGNFDFNINVKKERENSTLTLILFESSARDGSRQHVLPIALK